MRINLEFRLLAASIFGLAFTVAVPAFAQSASSSFHSAGEATENAGSSAGHAIAHAYEGTKTAVVDTDTTAKVKLALHNQGLTKGGDIDVDTVDGVVTLSGHVPSTATSHRAVRVTENVSGVRMVRNWLHVTGASAEE